MSPTKLLVTAPPHTRSIDVPDASTRRTAARSAMRATSSCSSEPPALTSLSKHMGRAAGGDTVIVRGRAFTPGVHVLFGKKPAASVTRVSRQELKVVSPKGTPGVVNVRVTTPYGRAPIVAGGTVRLCGCPDDQLARPHERPGRGRQHRHDHRDGVPVRLARQLRQSTGHGHEPARHDTARRHRPGRSQRHARVGEGRGHHSVRAEPAGAPTRTH